MILEIHAADPRAWREFADAAEGWARLPEDCCGRVVGYLGRMLEHLEPGNGKGH